MLIIAPRSATGASEALTVTTVRLDTQLLPFESPTQRRNGKTPTSLAVNVVETCPVEFRAIREEILSHS
jgi:hypothetical protein